MVDPARVQDLNDDPVDRDGKYVLYWMQQSQRAAGNAALEFACLRANELGKPVVVGFGLMDGYPEANERHYAFMLEGLRDTGAALRRRGVKLVARRGEPAAVAVGLARDAAVVVCDRGYLRHQRRWRDHVADHAGRRVVQVEADVVVPVEAASDKQEVGARTLRPKLHKLWQRFLKPVETVEVRHPSVRMRVEGDVDVSDVEGTLGALKIDRSVHRSRRFSGGYRAAQEVLRDFVSRKLDGYAQRRNDASVKGRGSPRGMGYQPMSGIENTGGSPVPRRTRVALGATSMLGPYLHFGQISPVEVALEVRASRRGSDADREAFLEELLVRRELSVNFVHYCPDYDRYEGLPAWARKTLDERRGDRREVTYTPRQLEGAKTADPYWNAAQREMVVTGFMHNRMRMYWGKKILEWSQTPEQAYETTLRLNNKYFLCGRDPNAYANVGWVLGLHDRPWGPRRAVFGTVRYMNAAGLERKFDVGGYVRWVEGLRV